MPSPVSITLCPHLATAERSWLTLRTAGVSDYQMAVPKEMNERRYCELLTYLPSSWQILGADTSDAQWWPARLLKQLGQFVHEQETWFADGHTVVVSEFGETYSAGTLVTAALLLAPRIEPPEFDELVIDGTPCRFLWVFPITEAEVQFKLEHGADALLELMSNQKVSHVLDPGRACLLTGQQP